MHKEGRMAQWKRDEAADAVFAEKYVGWGNCGTLGSVVRYYDDAPTYAWAGDHARLGAFQDDASAKAAVEAAVKNGDRT